MSQQKAIIDKLVSDCIETSKKNIAQANIQTVDNVYTAGENLIVLSDENNTGLMQLEAFLMQNFYLHKSLLILNSIL